MIDHDTAVWLSKSYGLFYLIFMSLVVVAYCYWPANKAGFEAAANSILHQDDRDD